MAKKTAAKTAKAAGAKASVEKPIPAEKQTKTAQEERLENNPTGTRVDGTTARHTEPLGAPAPGQQGRPGPERRVAPSSNVAPATEPTDDEVAEANAKRGAKIQVVATQTGYIDHARRRPGDVFSVYADQLSEKWMKRTDGKQVERTTGAKAALKKHHDDTLAERAAQRQSTGSADVLS